jgi:hypothetical protein
MGAKGRPASLLSGHRQLLRPEPLKDRAAPGGALSALMALGGWYWWLDRWASLEDDQRDIPQQGDLFFTARTTEGSSLYFTVRKSGEQLEASLLKRDKDPIYVAPDSLSPDRLDPYRLMAAREIGKAADRLFGETLGIDLLRQSEVVEELTLVIASGAFGSMRAGAAPAVSPSSPIGGDGGGTTTYSGDPYPDNMPPVANGDDFLVGHNTPKHHQPFYEPPPGVEWNDYDPDMDDFWAEVIDPPSHDVDPGSFTIAADGSFYYEPIDNWCDVDTFTYRLFDGQDYSDPAGVNLAVVNWPPEVGFDPGFGGSYYVETGRSLFMLPDGLTPPVTPDPDDTVIHDSVRTNDSDPDDDDFTLHVEDLPQHGTLAHFDDIDGDALPDGGFLYTAEYGYSGADSFTYYANDNILDNGGNPTGVSGLATVSIYVLPRVNLTIYNGPRANRMGGMPVNDADEETIGAFTVANLNDTDGDGIRDNVDDNGIPPDPSKGEPEIDLIALDIDKPVPDQGGMVDLYTTPTMVRLWEEPWKETEITLDTHGNGWLATSELPKTVWVEILNPSVELRDVEITAYYPSTHLSSDTVKVTGVWATMTAVEHDTKDAAELFAPGTPWQHMTTPPRDRLEQFWGGTGLRPVMPAGVFNSIAMQFTLQPQGVETVSFVHFDLTRRRERSACFLDPSGAILAHTQAFFPDMNERANDDGTEEDESGQPNASGEVFSIDGPGVFLGAPPPGAALFVFRGNFEEFVRVAFGEDVSGDGLRGTRASDKFLWHCRHRLVDQGGAWARTTGDQQETDQNDIGGTHIVIGTSP